MTWSSLELLVCEAETVARFEVQRWLTYIVGYTGRVVAEYIAANFPVNAKWAVAGRSVSKLQVIVEDCKTVHSDRTPPGLLWPSLPAHSY
jgi:hypothetical protein